MTEMEKRDWVTLSSSVHVICLRYRWLLVRQLVEARTTEVNLMDIPSLFPFPFPCPFLPPFLRQLSAGLGTRPPACTATQAQLPTEESGQEYGLGLCSPPAQQQHTLRLAESVMMSHLSFSRTEPIFFSQYKIPKLAGSQKRVRLENIYIFLLADCE